jgi:hypothetical protein
VTEFVRQPASDTTVPSKRAPSYAAATWGPYYEALHPPFQSLHIVPWKVVPEWMDHATRLWQQRQALRRTSAAIHGTDPATWPTRHPGVVLDDCAACVGCHWMFERGYYRLDRVFQYPVDLARRHETSNGAFRGGDDRLMPTARATLSPPPVETPPIPRRTGPIPPLRLAALYASGSLRLS